jgi:bifunctional UDP-N-acetylglucosamine pyrophosphorylase/glucosamine-1-phosphate N-acetyltransferase
MCGDSPLFTGETVRRMIEKHVNENAAVTLTTATLTDPFGYGRIVRDATGAIRAIVEERCASDDQRLIREANGGAYVFDSRRLFDNIDKMRLNEAGECNLTDMVRVFIEQGYVVTSIECDPVELAGVNTVDELRRAEEVLRNRQCA